MVEGEETQINGGEGRGVGREEQRGEVEEEAT